MRLCRIAHTNVMATLHTRAVVLDQTCTLPVVVHAQVRPVRTDRRLVYAVQVRKRGRAAPLMLSFSSCRSGFSSSSPPNPASIPRGERDYENMQLTGAYGALAKCHLSTNGLNCFVKMNTSRIIMMRSLRPFSLLLMKLRR